MKAESFSYADAEAARAYISYVESPDGQAERQLLGQAIFSNLPEEKNISILDAACGTGWLTDLLKKENINAIGCDASPRLLNYARQKYPDCTFIEADITENPKDKLPITPFDLIVLSLASHDIENLSKAYGRLSQILKPGGSLIITTANPYYSFPVGRWKRGMLGRLLAKQPSLRLSPYNFFIKTQRKFFWKKNIPSFFHTLPETINEALQNGFDLKKIEELARKNNSSSGRARQMHLYPMIFLFVFKKR